MTHRRTPVTHAARLALVIAVGGALVACGGNEIRRFPLAETMWVDPDENHLDALPDDYYSGFAWDAVDQTFFVPMSRYLSLDVPGPATNVNALDEVPDSSWFTNRIGLFPMDAEALRRGACPENRLDTNGPWTVTAAKPNGANPGFIIRDAEDRGWLLKFDGTDQPEQATSADVFGSRVYHAAGYWAPCNIIVEFDPDILVIGEDAESEDEIGRDVPMEDHHVQTVLDAAVQLPDGRLRASASLFLPGRPIGPFTYQGRRRDDPNDIIRHEDRRDLRGAEVLAGWLNHFDAREQNSLTIIAQEDGRSFVRHYYLDFGDCLGSRWEYDGLSRRFGNSNYLDIAHVAADFATLGAITRPWDTVAVSTVAPSLGYFDAEHYDPEHYHAGYPNPAFASMRAEDAAWMARIIARMDEPAIRAMLDEARISSEAYEEELVRTLLARRTRLLDVWLRARSPLADFEVQADGTTVCFADLASTTGVVDRSAARYAIRTWYGDWHDPAWTLDSVGGDDPSRLCVPLVGPGESRPTAAVSGVPDDAPERYQIVDLVLTPEPGSEPIPPARLHFYDLGDRGFRLVGIERPDSPDPPGTRR